MKRLLLLSVTVLGLLAARPAAAADLCMPVAAEVGYPAIFGDGYGGAHKFAGTFTFGAHFAVIVDCRLKSNADQVLAGWGIGSSFRFVKADSVVGNSRLDVGFVQFTLDFPLYWFVFGRHSIEITPFFGGLDMMAENTERFEGNPSIGLRVGYLGPLGPGSGTFLLHPSLTLFFVLTRNLGGYAFLQPVVGIAFLL